LLDELESLKIFKRPPSEDFVTRKSTSSKDFDNTTKITRRLTFKRKVTGHIPSPYYPSSPPCNRSMDGGYCDESQNEKEKFYDKSLRPFDRPNI
jgi:hypothetical protein